jgi:hypothetical protein
LIFASMVRFRASTNRIPRFSQRIVSIGIL